MKTAVYVCVAVCLQSLLVAANILHVCKGRCRADEQLKAQCRAERNCDLLLPDLQGFLTCVKPCSDLGNNCFQRCAFKTDRIESYCSRRCRLDSISAPVQTPGDVSGSDISTSEEDNIVSNLCYKACYDSMLNAAMDRVYRKRPGRRG